jgi:hypothetical protein
VSQKKAREEQKWKDVLLLLMLQLAATMHAKVGRTQLLPFPSLLPLLWANYNAAAAAAAPPRHLPCLCHCYATDYNAAAAAAAALLLLLTWAPALSSPGHHTRAGS